MCGTDQPQLNPRCMLIHPLVGALDEVHVEPIGVAPLPLLQYWSPIRRKKIGHRRIERDKVGNRTQCQYSSDGCEQTTTVRFGLALSFPESPRGPPRPPD